MSTQLDDVKSFLARHNAEDVFAYASIVAEFAAGTCTSHGSGSSVSIESLRVTYAVRAELEQASSIMNADIKSLSLALDECPSDVRIWGFDFEDGRILVFFERTDTNGIAGFFRAYNRWMVDADASDRLWGSAG